MKEQLNELLQKRVSLRRYADRPITLEDMDFILKSAMRAPTAGNMMLYSVIKVEKDETKKKLAKSCDNQPFIARAPSLLIFCADFQRWYDYYQLSGVPEVCLERETAFHLPEEGEFLLAAMDTLIASSFATVAAEACGIGSCYIGDIVENYEIHKELLKLPKWVLPVGMLCLGYYPDNYKRSVNTRFDSKFIVSEETYHHLSDAELQEMMADKEKEFNSKNKFNAENFGQFNYFRKTGTEFSDEMTRSVKLMLDEWKSV
ncbi:nitroreductase family protein [Enterococcus sp. BWB1-3]|uniref:nitroreductase family protein n=1 Tax=unclassified Enterococcus TaxID=2608891 RepID=UPI0019206E5D|nr:MULTISPECIES: nitroreductase family protein [unclassified Enterococcus]MBL1229633.1 nitroreductase family protein [Enterococcus sp. BWB1-3]MCB5951990.1 nitroreductase family protein [Enterococcus sp. BWT-B8]MCB5954187.1 nitroreductase family protein [Enterococcus sp. CWB-B31]